MATVCIKVIAACATACICVALIGIGATYFDDESCRFHASKFLVAFGIINLLFPLLCWFAPSEVSGAVLTLVNLCLLVFGCFFVLKNWGSWDSTDKDSPLYCHPVPMTTALTVMVVKSLCLCVGVCVAARKVCANMF